MSQNVLILLGAIRLVSTYWLRDAIFDIQLYYTSFVVGWSVLVGTVGLLCLIAGLAQFIVKRRTVQ